MLPLDDRRVERFNPDLAGRPQLVRGNSQLLFGGMGRLERELGPRHQEQVATRSPRRSSCPTAARSGVIIAQGGAFGGWSLYVHDGRPAYCYNLFGLQRFKVYGEHRFRAGEHQVRMEFAYDGGGLGKGGDVTLYVDGKKVGEGRVDATVPMALLRRRDHATSAATAPRPSATTTARATTSSPAASAGSRSTSTKPPRTSTT